MLEFESVSFSYDEKPVLENFNFHAEKGTVTCVLGPSGLGKTTLMNLAAGLLKPQKGRVKLFEGRYSFIFQEDRLLPWLTSIENITAIGAKKEQAEIFLEKVGLFEAAEKYPNELSGGMKRRLAIARAFAFGGDVFFIDEPLQGLDVKTYAKILSLLKCELEEKTAMVITHSPKEALSLGNRIMLVGKTPLKILADAESKNFTNEDELKKYMERFL